MREARCAKPCASCGASSARRSLSGSVMTSWRFPPPRLACDATQFEQAIAEKRFEDAFELYRGEFLPGLFVPDAAPEFDDWLDAERSRLRHLALDAASRLIASSRERGGPGAALPWARRAASIAPDDERLQTGADHAAP